MGFKPEELAIMLEEAKQYTDSKRLGYTEPNVLTFDGNPENVVKEFLVKISDNVYDLNSIVSITVQMGDEPNKFDKSVIVVDGGASAGTEDNPAMVTSLGNVEANILGIEPGTYFFYSVDPESNEKYYVSRVEFAETVHQIDPKFIPNTVINLCDYGLNVYEILGTAVATGKMSGSMIVDAMDEDFWKMLPRKGEPVTFCNDDGQNDPVFLYGAILSPNRPNNGGSITFNLKLIDNGLKKIINIMLIIYSQLSVQTDGTVKVGNALVEYIIELQDNPIRT